VAGTVAVPLPCLALALHGPVAVVAVAALAAGAGISLSGTFSATAMQQCVPPDMLARLTAFTLTGSFALGSAGLAVIGPVADALGPDRVLGFAAVYGLVSALVVLCLPAIRGLPAIRDVAPAGPAAGLPRPRAPLTARSGTGRVPPGQPGQ
jgi:hypothetical protein